MKVSLEELNALAEKAFRVNAHLLKVKTSLLRAGVPRDVQEEVETARRVNWSTLKGLVKLGADDPTDELQARLKARFVAAGGKLPEQEETPLHLLSSPAARRYAAAIREAATACREMETERYGPHCDGLAEMLEDWAADAERETYGPPGLNGME